MAKGFKELEHNPKRAASITPNGWPAARIRDDAAPAKAVRNARRAAKLRHAASVEDVDYRARAASTAPCS